MLYSLQSFVSLFDTQPVHPALPPPRNEIKPLKQPLKIFQNFGKRPTYTPNTLGVASCRTSMAKDRQFAQGMLWRLKTCSRIIEDVTG